MAGYIVMGIGFGVLLASHGYGPLWAFCMSLFIFAGSLQYVSIDLLANGASLITTALMSFMVNVRHLFYAIAMVGSYRDTGKVKPYLACALTDETYALVCKLDLPADVDKTTYCTALSMMNHSYWIIGGLIGDIIGISVDFDFTGADFAMTAMFVAIATDQWLKTKDHTSAITGFAVSLGCLLIWGPDSFLIPTMIIITVALWLERTLGILPWRVQTDGGDDDDQCL